MIRRYPRAARGRSAFALVEVVGLIIIAAGIMSLSAIVINQAWRAHQRALEHFRQTLQLQRFADRLREDVHRTTHIAVEESKAGTSLRLRLSDESQIAYGLEDGQLRRVVVAGDQQTSQQAWHVPPLTEFACSVDRSGRRPLVACRLVFQRSVPTAEAQPAAYPSQPWLEWVACALPEPANPPTLVEEASHD